MCKKRTLIPPTPPPSLPQGSEIVMEDLIDDVVRESNPYKPPEKVMKRSDLASEPVRDL